MMFTTLSTVYPHVQNMLRLVVTAFLVLFLSVLSLLCLMFCDFTLQTFKDHMIDGETLPLLSEEHLLDTLGLKLGPALKIRSQVGKADANLALKIHSQDLKKKEISWPDVCKDETCATVK